MIQNSTSGYLPKEMSPNIHQIACIKVFGTALFIVAPNWKQPKSSLTLECNNFGIVTHWNIAKQ